MNSEQFLLKTQQKIVEATTGLQKQNERDLQEIERLNEEYKAAIVNFELEKADSLNSEAERLKSDVANRNRQIGILQAKDNPTLKQAVTSYLNDLSSGIEDTKRKASQIEKEVRAAQLDFLKALVRADEVNREFHSKQRTYSHKSKTHGISEVNRYAPISNLINLSKYKLDVAEVNAAGQTLIQKQGER